MKMVTAVITLCGGPPAALAVELLAVMLQPSPVKQLIATCLLELFTNEKFCSSATYLVNQLHEVQNCWLLREVSRAVLPESNIK